MRQRATWDDRCYWQTFEVIRTLDSNRSIWVKRFASASGIIPVDGIVPNFKELPDEKTETLNIPPIITRMYRYLRDAIQKILRGSVV